MADDPFTDTSAGPEVAAAPLPQPPRRTASVPDMPLPSPSARRTFPGIDTETGARKSLKASEGDSPTAEQAASGRKTGSSRKGKNTGSGGSKKKSAAADTSATPTAPTRRSGRFTLNPEALSFQPPELKYAPKFPKRGDGEFNYTMVRDRIMLRNPDGSVAPLSLHLNATEIARVHAWFDRMVAIKYSGPKKPTVEYWYTVSRFYEIFHSTSANNLPGRTQEHLH